MSFAFASVTEFLEICKSPKKFNKVVLNSLYREAWATCELEAFFRSQYWAGFKVYFAGATVGGISVWIDTYAGDEVPGHIQHTVLGTAANGYDIYVKSTVLPEMHFNYEEVLREDFDWEAIDITVAERQPIIVVATIARTLAAL